MAIEVRRFTVTTPAGTAQSTPLTTKLTIPPRRVDEVRFRIPPGPSGQLGFQLLMGGQVVIPFDATQWIIADDEVIAYPLDNFPTSGGWALLSYNGGSYDHSIWVTLLCALPGAPPPAVLQPLSFAHPSATATVIGV